MRALKRVIGVLIASIVLGAAVGYLSVLLLPCDLFGSNFEGACGYGALFASMLIGGAVALLVFMVAGYMYLFKGLIASIEPMRPTRREFALWSACLLACLVASFLLPMAQLGSLIDAAIGLTVSAGFVLTSAILLKKLGSSPAYSLLAYVPLVGVFIVAGLVVHQFRARDAFAFQDS